MNSIVLGVVSGVTTSAIIYGCITAFNHLIVPWYQQMIYRGVDISGAWKNELTIGEKTHSLNQISTYHFSQKAHNVTANISIVKVLPSGKVVPTETLKLKGEVRDRILYAMIHSKDDFRIAAAALLLEIYGNGSKMRGTISWYDGGTGKIQSESQSEWIRIKNQPEDNE